MECRDLHCYLVDGSAYSSARRNEPARELGAADLATTIQTQKQRITTQLAIRGIWVLAHEPGVTQEQESQIYCLDDGYDLAVAGTYGTMDDIERNLHDFVSPYAVRLAKQYPQLIPTTK